MKCQVVNQVGQRICNKQAVWLHTFNSKLSVCEEHFSKIAASKLGSITSEAKTTAVRENGKKGGRPRMTPAKPTSY